jgi:HAD superfamily hydrolase (TIGR01509 family)
MNYDLVIFDCDGTLVDSEPLTMQLLAKMMLDIGVQEDYEKLLENFAGKSMKAITDLIKSHIGPFDTTAFEEEYRQRCVSLFQKELQAIPGVVDLIHSIPVAKCIASNGPHRKMNLSLSATGIDKLFQPNHIFSAYDVQKWKPDPALINYALTKMKTSEDKAVLIEDTISGVLAGLNAKVDTIAFNPNNEKVLLESGAINFTSMEDIKQYLLTS